ncbi:phage holin family protein [Auraticoccus sp. F435]|uniref:Phage holin family protein n=1 Tax=Auraticoccus cholistanensis TaxID=2656650 RepID=A0A6A9V041_9ACTN|nr:phage holin family protein [Auraticoccus cholistanensis]MVA74760.1 phage holin family protein [Auraticoccus cholistanensis]
MLLRLLANAAALGVATLLLPGIRLGEGDLLRTVLVLLAVALVFGVVNAVVKPVFTAVTLPVVILSLGIFLLVINALMLMLTSWVSGLLDLGWHVDGFWNALFGALIISVVSFVLNAFLPDRRRRRRGARA